MSFDYLIEKISSTEFSEFPFRHLYIENFLSRDHLEKITQLSQIKLAPATDTRSLINIIKTSGYQIQGFPGCVTDIEEYLAWLDQGKLNQVNNHDIVEGIGLAFRLSDIRDPWLKELMTFLNSVQFQQALESKFAISRSNRISTSVQKYLTGYEISPHPDIRSKCLTYLVNINTDPCCDDLDIHTHLLSFLENKQHIKQYWQDRTDVDRCWVPWSWCKTNKIINKNNSLVMFTPGNDTLHAVKLDYDHHAYQRTQLYGNLWYLDKGNSSKSNWSDLPLA